MKPTKQGVRMNKILVGIALCAAAFSCGIVSAQDGSQVEAGQVLYDEHCSSCHGENLRSSGAMPDLRELGAGDRSRFDRKVSEGKDQMPSWEGVQNTQQLDQLWAYIRSRARG
jgi:mono/diheme cytochrome c family protein